MLSECNMAKIMGHPKDRNFRKTRQTHDYIHKIRDIKSVMFKTMHHPSNLNVYSFFLHPADNKVYDVFLSHQPQTQSEVH